MSNTIDSGVILAIESAIRGGSICLLSGATVLGARFGSGDISRAEDLLANIAELCETSGVEKSQIDTIAVSRGPGSYTGIRIGIATALGLSRALGCECLGVELLRSMAHASEYSGQIITAVPFSKNDAAWQEFTSNEDGITASGEPVVEPFDTFMERIASFAEARIVVHNVLGPTFQNIHPNIIIIEDPAQSIGSAAQVGAGSTDLTPIYIRNPDAAGKF